MPANSTAVLSRVPWRPAFCAAGIAVGGALAMPVVLGAVAMLAAAIRGVPPVHVPLLLTADQTFPLFCAAAGVLTALSAGYITTQASTVGPQRHALAAAALTVAGHIVVVGLFGSPLGPLATAAYVSLTLPAVCLGCYCGSPARNAATRQTSCG